MPSPRTPPPPWRPTRLEEVVEGPFDTSMGTAKVKTDATFGYLKALGNRQGPHALACELVGTALARWFGLPVAEFTVLHLAEPDCYALPRGARARPGPAFVSRLVPGQTWGKSADELAALENPADITRLVVFDNWVRNCDRHPPNPATRKPNYANVWLGNTTHPDRLRLYAIDHTHCFDRTPELSKRVCEIDRVRDNGVYGLFPEFVPFIDPGAIAWCQATLASVEADTVRAIVAGIPGEWEVSDDARAALVEFVRRRAEYLAGKMGRGWGVRWWESPAE